MKRRIVTPVFVAVASLALCSCSSSGDMEPDEEQTVSTSHDEDMESIDEEKHGETRGEYEERQDDLAGDRGSYYGDTCTVDCGGHEAGRAWAERRGITDPSECGGKSWSFQEGCETYAREQQEAESDY